MLEAARQCDELIARQSIETLRVTSLVVQSMSCDVTGKFRLNFVAIGRWYWRVVCGPLHHSRQLSNRRASQKFVHRKKRILNSGAIKVKSLPFKKRQIMH